MSTGFLDWNDAPEACQPELTGEQKLVAAVIRRALFDAHYCSVPAIRNEARAFLDGSDRLQFWCLVGGLRVQAVVQLATRVLSEPAPVFFQENPELQAELRTQRARRLAWVEAQFSQTVLPETLAWRV